MISELTVGGAMFFTLWLVLASIFFALLIAILVFILNVITILWGCYKLLGEYLNG